MGLMDWAKGQFIDIIEWTEPSQNEILAHRFPRHNNEIKNGAKLIVREGQAAGFVKEGQLADVKTPGMYTLDTQNMPILSTILGWKYGFESPFKCEVYFIATRQWTDQKWGTLNPVMYRDPEFGPVRLRAFGNYAFKVTDPGTFLKELVATDPSFELYEISAQFRNVIVSRFIDALGASHIPMLDLAGNYDRVSRAAAEKIAPELAKMGVSLTQFFVENISLPPEVEAALDKRSQMSVLGNLDQYAKMQAADAIRDAAQNPGGVAGLGAGLGAGVAVGQQMGAAVAAAAAAPGVVTPANTTPPAGAASGPPPLPTAVAYHAAIDGAAAGPFDMTALAGHVRAGKLTRSSLVWKSGMAAWAAAETVPELQPLFASVPPPLPG
ncbi:SPFH domain-containing protein [Frigoriglobus tundricola]|uniref:Virion core protein (Lumpy skin disease virus) n=1 Tax=Frigoriglobus tundricola TaxID=2774151 RepID=A0A6M5Z0S8_9BACT|nr:SPFH domain-containing protein [Frigoriglobus tundricola]QJW99346.1 Putative virion core protein (lumpy skin disease virus) [Frigoriglobus tundricola]